MAETTRLPRSLHRFHQICKHKLLRRSSSSSRIRLLVVNMQLNFRKSLQLNFRRQQNPLLEVNMQPFQRSRSMKSTPNIQRLHLVVPCLHLKLPLLLRFRLLKRFRGKPIDRRFHHSHLHHLHHCLRRHHQRFTMLIYRSSWSLGTSTRRCARFALSSPSRATKNVTACVIRDVSKASKGLQ